VSNFLAVAAVTATLSQLLETAVSADVAGATITTVRPEASHPAGANASVNLFLYHVAANPQWRGDDLPTRRDDGSLAQRPRFACDLHYLLTFHGDETRLEPQRLLGSVARTLHAQPVLTRAMIAAAVVNPKYNAFLGTVDAASFPEPVRVTPATLSLEELSKVWSIFYQTPYALTLAYQCSVVIIESDDVPREALPVLERFIAAIPIAIPRISAVAPALITRGASVTLSGTSLIADAVRVEVAGTPVPAAAAAGDALTFTLPAALSAGVLALQVVHPVAVDPKSTTKIAMRSDVVALVLRPTVSKPAFTNVVTTPGGTRTATFRCTLDPPVARGQRVVVSLNEIGDPAHPSNGYVFDVPTAKQTAATSKTISVRRTGLLPGTYIVRVQVDGADSMPAVDKKTGTFATPAVDLK
jgi:hypothetical protein